MQQKASPAWFHHITVALPTEATDPRVLQKSWKPDLTPVYSQHALDPDQAQEELEEEKSKPVLSTSRLALHGGFLGGSCPRRPVQEGDYGFFRGAT